MSPLPEMNPGVRMMSLKCLIPIALVSVLLSLTMTACSDQPGSRISSVPAIVPTHASLTMPVTTNTPTTSTAPSVTGAQPPAAPASQLTALLDAFDIEQEYAIITELASDAYAGRKSGTSGAAQAADYISSRFAGLGLKPWLNAGLASLRQSFTVRGKETDNVIGILPGSGGPEAGYVMLAAHYDHLGVDASGQVFNGADDNAAGVAAMLEAAEMIRQAGLVPVKNLVFCAFSGEEQGQYGSAALGNLISSQGLADQVVMFNIDGIGATGGDYLGVWDEGATNAAPLVQVLKKAGGLLGEAVREEGTDIGSDAQAFDWQYGIPAVTIDWNWGQDESAFHPYYHTVQDDPANISKNALARASKVAISGFWLQATS